MSPLVLKKVLCLLQKFDMAESKHVSLCMYMLLWRQAHK